MYQRKAKYRQRQAEVVEGQGKVAAWKENQKQTPPARPAHDYALFMMGRREYSQQELRQKMKLRGYEESVINETLEWLAREGYQSDRRYTQMLIRSQQNRYGNRHIQQVLKQKGIDEGTVAENMTEIGAEIGRAGNIVAKFANQDLNDMKIKAKIYRFLAYRGFSYDVIGKAWEQLKTKQTNSDEIE